MKVTILEMLLFKVFCFQKVSFSQFDNFDNYVDNDQDDKDYHISQI